MASEISTAFKRRRAELLEIADHSVIVRSELHIDHSGCERFLGEFLIAPKLRSAEPRYLLNVTVNTEMYGRLKSRVGGVHFYPQHKVNNAANVILGLWASRDLGDERPSSFLAPRAFVSVLKKGEALILLPPESIFLQLHLAAVTGYLDSMFQSWRDAWKSPSAEQVKLLEATHILTDRLGALVCQSRERVLKQLIL